MIHLQRINGTIELNMIKDASKMLVIDVEATCWDAKEETSSQSEIIQFGWCFVSTVTGERFDRGSLLVRPTRSKISQYCTDLTGLTWPDLKRHGVTYADACRHLVKMGMRRYACFCLGNDVDVINRQCKEMDAPRPFCDSWIDAGILLWLTSGSDKKLSLTQYCELFGVGMEGSVHSADWDAWNLAGVVSKYLLSAKQTIAPSIS